jgi:hypothetical protein
LFVAGDERHPLMQDIIVVVFTLDRSGQESLPLFGGQRGDPAQR